MNPDFKGPGHSTNKGYPYNNIPSKEMFMNRPEIGVNAENKPFIIVNYDIFQEAPREEFNGDDKWNQFLLNRLLDYSESLKIAEDQIEALLEELPFMPEHFGFELVIRHQDITEPPVRFYSSKYNDAVGLYRKPADMNNPEWDFAVWILTRKDNNGNFVPTELNLPCHRIAYATFFALGIKVDKPKEEEKPEEGTKEALPDDLSDNIASIPPGYKVFDVLYKEDSSVAFPEGRKVNFVVVAEDRANAIGRAKFILESSAELGLKDFVPFESIFVTERVPVHHGEGSAS